MITPQQIADKVEALIKAKHITKTKFIEECDLSKNAMASMKIFYPSTESLIKIADYFNCSVDFLLGRTQPEYSFESLHLSTEEQIILHIYRQLSTWQQQSALDYLQYLLSHPLDDKRSIINIIQSPPNTTATLLAARNNSANTTPQIDQQELENVVSKPSEEE